MVSFPEHNEKFTRLLGLYDVLCKQSLPEMQDICSNNLLSLMNNDHKLFADIIFYGMHHLLYKIDTKIIENITNALFMQINKNIKPKDENTKISKLQKKMDYDEYIAPKLTDIPSDVISSVICQYLDLNSLLSFEKTSKLILSRSRSARISEFDLNLSTFYAFDNTSYDLLRFKNTSKLTITMNGNHDYNDPYNNIKNTKNHCGYELIATKRNGEYMNLIKQFAYFRDNNTKQSSLNNVWLKAPSKSQRNMIISQLKQFYNLSQLIITRKSRKYADHLYNDIISYRHIDIINNMINNLPSFESLRKLRMLEINNISLQNTMLMLNKLNYNNVYKPIMIEKLHLFHLNINIEALKIMNDCMVNLNEIHLHEVAMEVDAEQNNYDDDIDDAVNINIDDLLMRLRTISIKFVNTAQNTTKKTVEAPLLTQLFMIGDSGKCGKPQFVDNTVEYLHGDSNSYSTPIIPEEIKCISDRKYLETLHVLYWHRTHLDALNYSVSMFSSLIELAIDCNHSRSSSPSSCSVSDIISKCKKLHRLSLIINGSFLVPFHMILHQKDMDENDINRFDKLCDSFMINNTSIKHLRISLDRLYSEHISSLLIERLIKYIQNKEIYKWRKLDSFQFLSKRDLSYNKNNRITMEILNDMKEFHLLHCIKDMIEKEYAVTFKGINTKLFNSHLNELWRICDKENNKYKIKIKNSDNMSYKERRNDETLIDLHIGDWSDKIHTNDETLFDFWSIDCQYSH